MTKITLPTARKVPRTYTLTLESTYVPTPRLIQLVDEYKSIEGKYATDANFDHANFVYSEIRKYAEPPLTFTDQDQYIVDVMYILGSNLNLYGI